MSDKPNCSMIKFILERFGWLLSAERKSITLFASGIEGFCSRRSTFKFGAIQTWPSSGVSIPFKTLKSELLPHPFLPTNIIRSSLLIENSALFIMILFD